MKQSDTPCGKTAEQQQAMQLTFISIHFNIWPTSPCPSGRLSTSTSATIAAAPLLLLLPSLSETSPMSAGRDPEDDDASLAAPAACPPSTRTPSISDGSIDGEATQSHVHIMPPPTVGGRETSGLTLKCLSL